MAFLKYKTLLGTFTTEAANNILHQIRKDAFCLRIQKSIKKKIKPHLFSQLKRQIAQINFKLAEHQKNKLD